MKTLREFHECIEERFRKLSAQRANSPVFVLEHNLGSDEIEAVKTVLHNAIALRDKSDIRQIVSPYYLPLLIIATEVGYRYRGAGTPFWDLLKNELNCPNRFNSSTGDRQYVRGFFERSHQTFKTVKPSPVAGWERQFNIIAYPITNSILPLDIRLSFLESIAGMPQKYYSANPDDIAQFLRRNSERQYATRYHNWLQAMPAVGQLAQVFITEQYDSHFLSAETLQRIRRDMEQDKNNAAEFRKRQEKIREKHAYSKITGKPVDPRRGVPNPTVYGKLFLVKKVSGDWVLEAQLPLNIVEKLRQNRDFKSKLRHGVLQLKWGANRSVKPACFLYQERIEIAPRYWNNIKPNVPFITAGDSNREYGLETIRFRLDCPVFFQEGEKIGQIKADSGIVDCIVNNYDNEDNIYGITVDRLPNDFSILHLDTSKESALDWCRRNGLTIRQKQHWHWVCPFGQVEKNECTIEIFENDSFYLSVESGHSVTLRFQNETIENVTGVFAFNNSFNKLPIGEHFIEIDDEKWAVCVSKKQPFSLFSAELQGEPIVDSLRDRSLALIAESMQPFVNIDYKVSLSNESGLQIEYSGKWDSLPQHTMLFRDAFEEKDSEIKRGFWQLIRSQEDLKIKLEIEGEVFKKEWDLESVNYGIWWKETETENPVPESDGEEEVYAEEILHKAGRSLYYPDNVRLFRAAQNGEPVYRATTILKHAKTFTPGNMLKLPERKLRQPSNKKDGVGLENIVDDILAFRQAQTESPVAEMQRRQILNELENVFWTITCGDKWTERMKEVIETDFKDCFVEMLKSLIREKLQWAASTKEKPREGVSQKTVSDKELTEKCEKMVYNIYKILPEFWMTFDHDTQDTEELLSNTVFETLKPILQEKTGGDDLNGVIKDWNLFFNRYSNFILWNQKKLADLIYPSQAGKSLLDDFHNDWSLKSITKYVEKYQKTLSGNPYLKLWKAGIIENVLAIFLNPAMFESELNRETLRAMLSDRQTMRGIAFLYCRKLQNEKIREAFGNV